MGKSPEELLAVRTKVAAEILATEKSYVESLGTLVDVYLKKFQEASKTGKKDYMSPKEMQTIFGNIELIRDLNARFLTALEVVMASYTNKTCIGHIFCEYAPFFKMYVTYCNGHSQAVHDYRKLVKKRDTLQKYEQESISSPRCKGLSFESYLIMPIQRIPRYKLLLTELLKNTPEDHPDVNPLSDALETVSEVAVKINEEIRNREMRDKVLEIQDLFVGEVPELIAPGRNFIMDGDLMKICRKADKQFHFFLFTDLFLYAGKGTRSGTYVLHRQFPINTGFMVIDAQDHDQPAFQIRHAQKSFVVYAKDQEEKKKWLEAINNCITEAYNRSIRATGDYSVDAAPLWAPDSSSNKCDICGKGFGVLNRRHHCRRCGRLVDGGCSKARMKLPNIEEEKVRVCDLCVAEIEEAAEEAVVATKNSSKENSKNSNPGSKENSKRSNHDSGVAGQKFRILNSDVQGEFMAALASKSPELKVSNSKKNLVSNLSDTQGSRASTPVNPEDDESDDDDDDQAETKTDHTPEQTFKLPFGAKNSGPLAPLQGKIMMPNKPGITIEPSSPPLNRSKQHVEVSSTDPLSSSWSGFPRSQPHKPEGPPPKSDTGPHKPAGPPPKKIPAPPGPPPNFVSSPSTPNPAPVGLIANLSPNSTLIPSPGPVSRPPKMPPPIIEEKIDHQKTVDFNASSTSPLKLDFGATSPKKIDLGASRSDFSASLRKGRSPPPSGNNSGQGSSKNLLSNSAVSATPQAKVSGASPSPIRYVGDASRIVAAIKDYDGSIEGYKLSYEVGDKVQILRKGERGYCVELLRTGIVGWVNPANFEDAK